MAKGTLLVLFDLQGEEVDFRPGQYFWVDVARPAVRRREGAAAAHLRGHVAHRTRRPRPVHAAARLGLQALARRAARRAQRSRSSSRRATSRCRTIRRRPTRSWPAGSGSPSSAACSATSTTPASRTGSRSCTRTVTASRPPSSTSWRSSSARSDWTSGVVADDDRGSWLGGREQADRRPSCFATTSAEELGSFRYLLAGPAGDGRGSHRRAPGGGDPGRAGQGRAVQRRTRGKDRGAADTNEVCEPNCDRSSSTATSPSGGGRSCCARAFRGRSPSRSPPMGGYDLHALIELVEQSCPPELAARILAPLEESGMTRAATVEPGLTGASRRSSSSLPPPPAALDAESRKWLRNLGDPARARIPPPACTGCCSPRRASSAAPAPRRTCAATGTTPTSRSSADDALVPILAKLDDYRGASRFTTWAYKFALLEAAVKMRRRAWQGREIPITPERWPPATDPTGSAQHELETREILGGGRRAIADFLTATSARSAPSPSRGSDRRPGRAAGHDPRRDLQDMHDARRRLRAAARRRRHPPRPPPDGEFPTSPHTRITHATARTRGARAHV